MILMELSLKLIVVFVTQGIFISMELEKDLIQWYL